MSEDILILRAAAQAMSVWCATYLHANAKFGSPSDVIRTAAQFKTFILTGETTDERPPGTEEGGSR